MRARRRTYVPRQNKEIIVSQRSVLVRVEQSIDVQAISCSVVVLQNIERLGVVSDLRLHGRRALEVAIGNRHYDGGRKKPTRRISQYSCAPEKNRQDLGSTVM